MSAWLAIDTTGTGCHVALKHQQQVYALSDWEPQSHAKRVLPLIDQLLHQAGIEKSALTGLIYTQGPGSFTGVRVGVSVAQGLAMGLSIPTLGVSSLLALAWQGYLQSGKSRVAAIIDARMKQAYWGCYAFNELGWQVMVADQLVVPTALHIPDDLQAVTGDVALLSAHQLVLAGDATIRVDVLLSLVALGLSQGMMRWSIELALPLYLRNDVADAPKK